MWIKRQVVMLPTNEKAKGHTLWLSKSNQLLFTYTSAPQNLNAQHLYILSDEDIKEGDWCLSKLNEIIQFKKNYDYSLYKKIIATTDKSLLDTIHTPSEEYKDIWKLPQPSEAFIQKYVEEYNKGNIITEVMVEYDIMNKGYDKNEDYPYQECKVLKVNPKDNTITIRKMKDNWSRNEIIELITDAVGASHDWSKENNDIHSIGIIEKRFLKKWIEENL